MPLVSKYCDLTIARNFHALIDHFCVWVEQNPFTWRNEEVDAILFDHTNIYSRCRQHCKLPSLITILDSLMNVYAEANGRKKWICVSIAVMIDSEHGFCLRGTAVCTTLSSRCLGGHGCVPSTVLPTCLFVGNSCLRDAAFPLFKGALPGT